MVSPLLFQLKFSKRTRAAAFRRHFSPEPLYRAVSESGAAVQRPGPQLTPAPFHTGRLPGLLSLS